MTLYVSHLLNTVQVIHIDSARKPTCLHTNPPSTRLLLSAKQLGSFPNYILLFLHALLFTF